MASTSFERAGAAAGTPAGSRPVAVVVMGVSGSGKTTVAAMLAERLHWRFEEGDDLHPAANVAKMSGGIPLTDEDRRPWLHAVAAVVAGWMAAGQSGVVACSALKRAYRRIVIGGNPAIHLVYLRGSRGLIRRRMAARQGHFMPPALLDSQFADLEEPTPGERAIVVSIDEPPDAIVAGIAAAVAAA
ncbi:MAG: gluconokinase [Stellaceae bacterium]